MSTIFKRAKEGVLTAEDLKSGDPEIDAVDPKTHLTPLGVAIWNDHVEQVELLLKKGADKDGPSGSRPPIWVAAVKAKKNAARIIQILLKHGADASRPSEIDGDSTPLYRAVKAYKPPDIISALVDGGASPQDGNGSGETAEELATKRNDRKTQQAMLPRDKRNSDRRPAILALSGLILGVVAWVNRYKPSEKAAAAGVVAVGVAVAANAIKKRFNMSGLFDSKWFPKRFQKKTPVENFEKDMQAYIQESHLDRFFPPGSKFLRQVVERAILLDEDPSNILDVHDLSRLALYQPYLYCDDSGSMKQEGRKDHQNELVKRITEITTKLVPDDVGVELRFINANTTSDMSKPNTKTIDDIMRGVPFNGWTEIGTNLRKKVLTEGVYNPLENHKFERPVLVSIITDGHPGGPQGSPEGTDTLKNAILECGTILESEEHKFRPTVVRFQISQIGADEKAGEFLRGLREDPKLQEVLYCTAERLDEEFKELRTNDTRLEQWLLQLLMGPILNADPN